MVAAAAYAFIMGKKVAGIYDHSTGQELRIAAEARGNQLQGFDGDRAARFGGTLPELYDEGDKAFVSLEIEGDKAFVSLEIDGAKAQGYDRGSSSSYAVQVAAGLVQLYDHGLSAWFAFDVQDTDATFAAQPAADARG